MTVVADNKKRVTLPIKPGARFEVQSFGNKKFILTRLAPAAPATSRVVISRRRGFSTGKLGHPINEAALREALVEFP